MKLLIILSLGLLSLGAMAQPDSKFDTPEVKAMQRQIRAEARKAKESKSYKSVLEKNFNRQGAIFNTRLTIKGDGEKAEISVFIKKTNGQSIKSGSGYVSTDHYSAEVDAANLSEVNNLIADGVELESKSIFNHMGFGESRKAELSSQGNDSKIDFLGGSVNITFSK